MTNVPGQPGNSLAGDSTDDGSAFNPRRIIIILAVILAAVVLIGAGLWAIFGRSATAVTSSPLPGWSGAVAQIRGVAAVNGQRISARDFVTDYETLQYYYQQLVAGGQATADQLPSAIQLKRDVLEQLIDRTLV
ncbi:MAG: SurA N-terminal domain-containing protein, partial [Patescibacteria group bacterium]